MSAVFKRELRAYFISPIGYVFLGVFLAISGFYFATTCVMGGVPTISNVLTSSIVVFLFLVPILTMRLLSEERGNKTDQILLTSPVSVPGIVLGKFLAAACVFVLSLVLSLFYMIILEIFGDPSWGEAIGGYVGFLFLGLTFIAIGMFVSSLTESPVVSAIATFGVLLILFVCGVLSYYVSGPVSGKIVEWVSLTRWYDDFAIGIFSVPSIVYYLSIIVFFLVLTIRQVEQRRWN